MGSTWTIVLVLLRKREVSSDQMRKSVPDNQFFGPNLALIDSTKHRYHFGHERMLGNARPRSLKLLNNLSKPMTDFDFLEDFLFRLVALSF